MEPIASDLIETIIKSITIIFCIALISFGIVGGIAFWRTKSGAAKSFGLLFIRGNFLRIATVFAVILAVIYLALLNRLSEGAVAVLSGIAGYVLGGIEKSETADNSEEQSK